MRDGIKIVFKVLSVLFIIKRLKTLTRGVQMTQTIREYLLKGEKESDFLISDVAKHGCGGGTVGELIYYEEIDFFYDKHHEEIWEELDQSGGLKDLINRTNRNTEPSSDAHFKCLLTWVAVEGVACKILNEREEKKGTA